MLRFVLQGGGGDGGGGGGLGGGGEGDGGEGEGGGGDGDGEGGEGGKGGKGGGEGGTGQAVWQTYFLLKVQPRLSHLPRGPAECGPRNCMQCWLPCPLSGSPVYQLVYDTGVLDGLHTHVPSDAASVPPIHT